MSVYEPLADADIARLLTLMNALEQERFSENTELTGGTPTYGLQIKTTDGTFNINESIAPSGSLEITYKGSLWWIDSDALHDFILSLGDNKVIAAKPESAIASAVINYMRTGWWTSQKLPEIEYETAAFATLYREESELSISLYGISRYKGYRQNENSFVAVRDFGITCIITLDSETLELIEFWTPGDGAYHDMDIADKFPENIANQLLSEAGSPATYTNRLVAECDKNAENYFGITLPENSSENNNLSDGLTLITSAGETVTPYHHFVYARTWTDYGWLHADGAPITAQLLAEVGDEIPTVVIGREFGITVNTSLWTQLFVYDTDFVPVMGENVFYYGFSALNWLPAGEYYCVFGVYGLPGDYIESEDMYEESGYQCVFRLVVDETWNVLPLSPADAYDFISAELCINSETYTVTVATSLRWLEGHFSTASQMPYGAACPFGALLYLKRGDGTVFSVCPAEDSCDVFFSGGAYYDYGASDSTSLWEMFDIPDIGLGH